MNNYSFLQRLLHQSILSSKLMREITFDVEKSIFSNNNDILTDDHVFVAGLARSGTTALLNALYSSNQFATLIYEDMPFVLAPNLWEKINLKNSHSDLIERAHGDNIKISIDSPEAFEEVFWKTYSDNSKIHKDFFKRYISLILKKNNKTRYLSKNNQNIKRLDLISEIFPKSKILIPFRDPLQQSFSIFSQHIRFNKKQNEDAFVRNYMKWIGHSEFGLDYKITHTSNLLYPNIMDFNHWLEQWYLTYNFLLELAIKNKQVYLIAYESLCGSKKTWKNIQDLLETKQEIKFSFEESKKIISENFDGNLSKKCLKLYDSMLTKSF